MKQIYYIILLLSLSLLWTERANAQKIVPQIGADYRGFYTFSSYKDDILRNTLNTEGAIATRIAQAAHLKLGFRFTPETPQGRFYPGAWQGIGTGVNIFGNTAGIGDPVAVYVFQGAPVWKMSRHLSLFYEWNFGASFGWKPCDGETTRSNLIVGSKINAYINLCGGLLWQPVKNWDVTLGLDLTHFSNGNTSFPNPGVNMAGLRIGIARSFGPDSRKDTVTKRNGSYVGCDTEPDTSTARAGNAISPESGEDDSSAILTIGREKKRKITYDLMMYGAWRKRVYRGWSDPVLLDGHFAVAGINFAPMWEVAPIFRAGVSADFQWDQSSNLKRYEMDQIVDIGATEMPMPVFSRPPFLSQVSCGLSARAELVMPIFSVNLGIGYNLVAPPEQRASYQMANLKLRLYRGLYLNIGYQLLNFSRQNNLMLGLGYTF